MVKPRHISPSCCLCILQPGPCDQRTNISSECQDAVWKGLVDAALRMRLHPFGTLYLHLLNVPLPLTPSRAAWRLICLMWRIPRSTESYIVWVYCLWLIFSVFYLQALLSTVTSHHFWNQRYINVTLLLLLLLLLYRVIAWTSLITQGRFGCGFDTHICVQFDDHFDNNSRIDGNFWYLLDRCWPIVKWTRWTPCKRDFALKYNFIHEKRTITNIICYAWSCFSRPRCSARI